MTARSRSCPVCRSIGVPREGCRDLWHVEVRARAALTGTEVTDVVPDLPGVAPVLPGVMTSHLDRFRGELDEVRRNVAHGDAQHNPWALQALAVADQLLSRVATLEADLASLGRWYCARCEETDPSPVLDLDDGETQRHNGCGEALEWLEPDTLTALREFNRTVTAAKNRAFAERDAALRRVAELEAPADLSGAIPEEPPAPRLSELILALIPDHAHTRHEAFGPSTWRWSSRTGIWLVILDRPMFGRSMIKFVGADCTVQLPATVASVNALSGLLAAVGAIGDGQ